MSNTIDIQCGIYDTEYTLTEHRDGSVTVREPYIHWDRLNTGVLRHRKVRLGGREAEAIKMFFNSGERVLPATNLAGYLTIQDVLDGHMMPGVNLQEAVDV